MDIRKATENDLEDICAIYDAIHAGEEQGCTTTGWIRSIYPTKITAEIAIAEGDMFVAVEGGSIVAAGRISQDQGADYARAHWQYAAPDDKVMVLHTLVVSPLCKGQGIGRQFVQFYEDYATAQGCTCLRMDTNARNATARHLYGKLGFREADIVPCNFQGLGGVDLVCLEKPLLTKGQTAD